MTRAFHRLVTALCVACAATSCSAAERCEKAVELIGSYAVCVPERWYSRIMPSGAAFMCDDPNGACTTAVGGMPLLGHATLSLVPVEVGFEKSPASLEEFAQMVADQDGSSRVSKPYSEKGHFARVKYVVVRQTYDDGSVKPELQTVLRYCVEANHWMFELTLSFNSGDPRSGQYRRAALEILRSIKGLH